EEKVNGIWKEEEGREREREREGRDKKEKGKKERKKEREKERERKKERKEEKGRKGIDKEGGGNEGRKEGRKEGNEIYGWTDRYMEGGRERGKKGEEGRIETLASEDSETEQQFRAGLQGISEKGVCGCGDVAGGVGVCVHGCQNPKNRSSSSGEVSHKLDHLLSNRPFSEDHFHMTTKSHPAGHVTTKPRPVRHMTKPRLASHMTSKSHPQIKLHPQNQLLKSLNPTPDLKHPPCGMNFPCSSGWPLTFIPSAAT
ncbi:Cyclic nucleotide-gated cation channel beta-1, partial [Ophiophagus hannah]